MQTNRYLVTVQRADLGAEALAGELMAEAPLDALRFERALRRQIDSNPVLDRCLPVQIDIVDNRAPQSCTFLLRFAHDCEKTILAFLVDGAVSRRPEELRSAVKEIP